MFWLFVYFVLSLNTFDGSIFPVIWQLPLQLPVCHRWDAHVNVIASALFSSDFAQVLCSTTLNGICNVILFICFSLTSSAWCPPCLTLHVSASTGCNIVTCSPTCHHFLLRNVTRFLYRCSNRFDNSSFYSSLYHFLFNICSYNFICFATVIYF